MKRYLIVGAVVAVAAVLLLLWPRRGNDTSAPEISEPPLQAFVPEKSSNQQEDLLALDSIC